MRYDLIVLGGGPSGMMAAITAAKEGTKVLLLEKNEILGKKILSTGNGRCNLTNERMDADCFYSSVPSRVEQILLEFGTQDLLDFMNKIGILTTQRAGYYYPYCMQATSVRMALEQKMLSLGIDTVYHVHVTQVEKTDSFKVTYSTEKHYVAEAKNIVFALGGLAFPKSGSDGSGFSLLKDLGIKMNEFVPALVPLTASEKYCRKLAGIRAQGRITLFIQNEEVASEQGEIQFTEYGVSGIPTFQISRIAAKSLLKHKSVKVAVDLFPEICIEDLKDLLKNRVTEFNSSDFDTYANGLLPDKILPVVAGLSGINPQDPIAMISTAKLEKFAAIAKALPFTINGTKGYDKAQTCAGGVAMEDLTDSLEVLQTPGVYVVGELVDVDGICGGYNLQWAFSSGYVAGKDVAKKRA